MDKTLIHQIRKNPVYPFMLVLVLSAMMGFQAWRTLLNNFAVEVVGADGLDIGLVQSLRELPGFLVFLVVFVLLFVRENRLASLSVIMMGLGIGVAGFFPTVTGLILTTVLMSTGFHYFETTNKSLTLQHFNRTQAPIMFARLRSYAALGNIAVGGMVALLMVFTNYKLSFLVIGLLVVLAGIYTIYIDPAKDGPVKQQKKIVLKKKYWLYYVLNLLSGARRQIFVVFAVFLLVEQYTFSTFEITLLFVLNNVASFFLNPVIGRAINHFGERKVLSFEYVGLFLVFMGYAYVDERLLVAMLYIIDHIFFNFGIGINTYLQKIAEPQDIAPSTSVGFAINHITAVFIPVVGGYLWLENHQIPFLAGAVLSIISLVFVQQIKINKTKSETPKKPEAIIVKA